MNDHSINFEGFNEELMSELTLQKAMEMESWLSALSLNPEIDLSFLDEPNMLTAEDEKTAQKYECLGRDSSNSVLLHAADVMRMMECQDLESELEGAENVSSISDCGEWLQLNQSSIRKKVKSSLPLMKGTGLDLDDLTQEASLAIFMAWDNYDPDSGITRDIFCRRVIYNRMLTLCRAARADRFAMTESMDAVALAHSDLEDIWLGGNVTWTSFTDKSQNRVDEIIMKEDLNAAMATIQEEAQTVLFLLAEGYTQKEIAGANGWWQSKVSYMAATGRKRLKAAIA